MNARSIKVRRIQAEQQGRAQQGRIGAIATAVCCVSLLAGCASPSAVSTSAGSPVALGADSSPLMQPPLASASTALKPVPVPNLIPATAVPERLPEVTTGRPDPFATLLMAPTKITRTASAPIAPSDMPLSEPLVALDQPMTASIPRTLPVFQPSTNSLGMPANGTLPILPAPISAAQAIVVSGVVQAGNTTSIIIKAPDERTSRYVSVGDRLANGRVLVKRVEMGAEPVVILEQDGTEVIKTIGSGGSVGTL